MIERHHSCRSLRFSAISCARNPLTSNPFPLTLLSDPHRLNPAVSISYKNRGGKGSRHSSAHVPTLLKSTLARQSASVANKRLTSRLSPVDATLTKNMGGGAR